MVLRSPSTPPLLLHYEEIMDNISRFMAVFEGFETAHGQTIIKGTRKNGKEEADSRVIRTPLSREHIEQHFSGEVGAGAIPINSRNTCRFGCIDVDVYPLDHILLVKQCSDLGAPAVVCRSKSGGAHIYFFIKTPISAADMRDKLSEIAAALGYGSAEIFPKQEKLLVERGDVGNFINLPYFGGDMTLRPAYNDKGVELSLEEFLDFAEKQMADPADFMDLQLGSTTEFMPECPPCLVTITTNGIGEGGRNETMFNIGVMYQKMDPDGWQQLLERHNNQYCNPPLPASEIVQIQQQLSRKEYQYACKRSPLKDYCNKSLCLSRKYGVGNGAQRSFEITGMSVVLSEPRVWFVDIGGDRLELTSEEVQMQLKFGRACLEQLGFLPPRIKDNDWTALMNHALQDCMKIEVPPELTNKGQFNELLESFCTGRVQAQSAEELVLNKPFTEDGVVYFKLDALMDFLKSKGFTQYTRGQVQERIKELNNGEASTTTKSFRDKAGKPKSVRVWFVPEFSPDVELPRADIKGQEVPF